MRGRSWGGKSISEKTFGPLRNEAFAWINRFRFVKPGGDQRCHADQPRSPIAIEIFRSFLIVRGGAWECVVMTGVAKRRSTPARFAFIVLDSHHRAASIRSVEVNGRTLSRKVMNPDAKTKTNPDRRQPIGVCEWTVHVRRINR